MQHAVELGARHRQPPRPAAGRQQQSVIREPRSVLDHDLATGRIDRGGAPSEMEPHTVPLDIVVAQPADRGLRLAEQQLLGQGRALVRKVNFGPDQIDGAVEPGGAHGADGDRRGLAAADDHDGVGAASPRPCFFRRFRPPDAACADSRPFEIDEDGVAFNLHRVGLDILGQRRAQRLAGADVEAALVQRALDLAVLDETFAQQRQRMGADAGSGEDPSDRR